MHSRTRVAASEVSAISPGSIGPPLATRKCIKGPETLVVRSERRARCVVLVRQSARGVGEQAVFPRPPIVVDVDEVVLETELDDDEGALVGVVVGDDVLVELLDVEEDDVVLDVVVVDPGSVLLVTVDDVELEVAKGMEDDEEVLDDDEVVVAVVDGVLELLLDVLVEVGADEDVDVEDEVLVVVVDTGPEAQSRSQVAAVSSPLHMASPQHTTTLWSVQEAPHRAASQPTGLVPPLPQQKRLPGLPDCTPAQSVGQETQFSPSPTSQIPLPQRGPPTQSCGHDPHVSVASQIPLAHAA